MSNENKPDALILCGGKATRLLGLNGDLPKALTQINHQSILSHLIQGLNEHINIFYISIVQHKDIFTKTLKSENHSLLFKRIKFVEDTKQEGTAIATQQLQLKTPRPITVINGDTLFDYYEFLIPTKINNKEIIITTTNQAESNSSVVSINNKDGTISFSQNREAVETKISQVSSGIITFGPGAFSYLKKMDLKNGSAIENIALSLQTIPDITFLLNKTEAKFIDFGTPKKFLNAQKLLRSLNMRT